MPYPNEHAARVRDPGDFQADSFRRKEAAPGVSIVMGKLKGGNGAMTAQTYRFDTKKFTEAQAKKWLADNKVGFKSFEAAAEAKKAEASARPLDVPEAITWSAPVEIAAAADGEDGKPKPRTITIRAYSGGPLRLRNFPIPVIVDVKGMAAAAKLPILVDHELSRVVGHTTEIDKPGDRQVVAQGLASHPGQETQAVLASHDAGFPWEASIGALPDASRLVEVPRGRSVEVNGRTWQGPLIVARKSRLREISLTAIGADGAGTSVTIAASAASILKREVFSMDFEKWVQAMGFELATLTDQQKEKLQAKYDAEIKAAGSGDGDGDGTGGGGKKVEGKAGDAGAFDPPEFDLTEIKATHKEHMADIEASLLECEDKIEAKAFASLNAKAIKDARALRARALKERWLTVKYETEIIRATADLRVELVRAERPQGPAIHAAARDLSAPVIEAAFCRTLGLKDVEKQYKPEVLEASDRFRNLGLQEVLLMCATANGYTGRMKIGRDNLRDVIEAAFSTHTISTMLTTAGNKLLLEGFQRVPQSWREVGSKRTVTDFKAVTAYRMTASLEYEQLGSAGNIKHGTLGQESYSVQARTYAKMLSLTREDVINDDLGAFDDLRNRLGIGAAVAMNKKFWTVWLAAVDAGTFWTVDRGNLQTGAATVLGEAGLNTAVKLFRDASGPDGNMLGLEPDRLLVPSDLEATARKLYVSQEMRDTTANTKTMVSNIYFNRFKPVVVPELSNAAYTGYSLTHWFLCCDPAILASAAMCFLNGVEQPTIESSDADFDELGIQLRGYHDFGVSMTEYRASVESAGA